ncbi:MAG: F0F1 ATP synthase subunit epsilon [Chloroflexi bacterium]|nr:F0F1 ATP synthase subunit epsilon [Chloroflexota bacterium]MDA1173598.1 F0F1 ATP synthase subunit epsilon [Chloroflexota bacterium]
MPMRLEIVTAERILFEGEVDVVVAPGGDGELGVLPHHAAVMTTLAPGELRYRVGGEDNHYVVHGGFMDVRGDQVVVLADAAEHVSEIDEARAEEAIARAQERIATRGEDVDLERALASQRRAQVRLRITRRHRRQRPTGAGSVPQ